MKIKFIPAIVISLWILLFSAHAVAESFSDTVNRVLPSVCMVISKVVISIREIDSPAEEGRGRGRDNIPPSSSENDDDQLPVPPSEYAPRPAPPESMGTCFIVSYKNEKFVITNHHVVDSSDDIVSTKIRFYGNFKTYPAIIVGKDKKTDIAVLKMTTPAGQAIIGNISELQWGNSNNMRPGDDAWAVGHPMQQEWSVSKGIISYIGRRTNNIRQELIQSDVAINTGNSGGPLLNMKGEVIGVNTFIFSSSQSGGGQIGVNFSVTSNLTKRVMEQLIDTGLVKRGKIGVLFEIDHDKGLFVIKELEVGAPAEVAGIKPEDLIVTINGRAIFLIDDIGKAFDHVLPGDEVEVIILRGDEILKIIIKAAELVDDVDDDN